MYHLCLSDSNPPNYQEKFWEVQDMLAIWRENMADFFSPAWIICLDKSMSIWHSWWTCPGWVFCPRNPHIFGNEHHTIWCGEMGVSVDFEMVYYHIDDHNNQWHTVPSVEGT